MLTTARVATLSLLAVLPLAPPALSAQQGAGDRFEEVRAFIRRTMEENRLPSVTVAVARDGEVLWEEGFGWADLERREPATPGTLYSLASISKPMTATAVMRLAERGVIDLDRPANDYLGEARIHSDVWDPAGATVRRVLSHQAGLPLHYEFFYQGESHPPRTTDEGIARYAVLVNPPGQAYEYSNLGYGVLERILERVTGRPYADVVRAEVFEPLGMKRSVVSTGAGLRGAAVRYDGDLRPIPPYDFDHRGGSAVYASARDLLRFGMFHLGERGRKGRAVLGDEARLEMQRIQTGHSRWQGYGLGWSVARDVPVPRVAHTGGMPGVATVLNLYPAERLVVAVLTNKSDRVVNRIAELAVAAVLPQASTVSPRVADRPSAWAPPEALRGEWTGTVRTYEGSVPLALTFQPDGDVHVRLGDGLRTLLDQPTFQSGRLIGRFAGIVPTTDARRHPHTVLLNLRLDGDRLVGAVTAQTLDEPIFFALSSFAELRRATLGP